MEYLSSKMRAYVEEYQRWQATCPSTVMTQCLEAGGRHLACTQSRRKMVA